MQSFKLDPEKFPRIQRNMILTYVGLAIVALVVFYLYIGNALFTQAWMLIPFVLVVFAITGWYAIRQRRKYWERFEIDVEEHALFRLAPGQVELKIRREGITGFKEVRQGLVVATATSANTLLIPRELRDEDYEKIRRILTRWTKKRS